MSASYQDYYPLECNLGDKNNYVTETLSNLGWKYYVISYTEFEASLGFSIGNWGEKVSISFNENTMLIRSKSIGPQIFDYGKNKNNVIKFISELNHTIKINNIKERGDSNKININPNSSSSSFIEKILNCYKLFENNLLSKEEFSHRKNTLIKELKGSEASSQPEDFLISILPLKDKGIIDDSDLESLKSILYEK